MIKKYSYEAVDGTHFPDANIGDDLYYAIDISPWLTEEADTLTSVTWSYPKGLTSSDNFLVGMEATIKVATNTVGSFRLTCKIESTENGKTQTNAIPMMLRVY